MSVQFPRVVRGCKFGNYLRIQGGSRKSNANGRTLFANGVRRSVMLFEWLSPSMGLMTGNKGEPGSFSKPLALR